MSETIRVDKLLANLGYGSRRAVTAIVRAGRVSCDGAKISSADKVSLADAARLTIAGEPVDPPPGIVLMVHKPLGMTCSHKEHGPLVYDLFPARWRRRAPPLSSIGRLDKDTTGLLLVTDDGALLHRVIAPKSRIKKRYRATLARPIADDAAEIFASGTFMLKGEMSPLLPALLEIIGPTEALVTIIEGRYHQVRRMFAALGNHVETLHREAIGALMLPANLEAGMYRALDPTEARSVIAAEDQEGTSASRR